jgi:hypothetical protein
MGYRLEGQYSIPNKGTKFVCPPSFQTSSGTRSSSYPVGIVGCFLGGKQPERDINPLEPSGYYMYHQP